MTRRAGIGQWHAHEARHTAASIMSTSECLVRDSGNAAVPVEYGSASGAL